MRKLIWLVPWMVPSLWAAAIGPGTFQSGYDFSTVDQSSTLLQLAFPTGAINQLAINLTCQNICNADYVTPFTFGGNYMISTTLPTMGPPNGTVTINGIKYTAGPNLVIEVSLDLVATVIPIPPAQPCPTDGGPNSYCSQRSIAVVPFTMTGSVTVLRNGSVFFSDVLSGDGTMASYANSFNMSGFSDSTAYETYTFSPEPATLGPLGLGIGVLAWAGWLKRRRTPGN